MLKKKNLSCRRLLTDFLHVWRILPPDVSCPGGNASWEKVYLEEGNRVCRGQMDVCNQTGQLCKFPTELLQMTPDMLIFIKTWWSTAFCPENSLCAPYGPGFFECSCTDDHRGYKCLREVSPANGALRIQDSAWVMILNLYIHPPQGQFPIVQVFGPLGAFTAAISFLLWFTQRRHVKRGWTEKRPRVCYTAFLTFFLIYCPIFEQVVTFFYLQTDILKTGSFTDCSLLFTWRALNMCCTYS